MNLLNKILILIILLFFINHFSNGKIYKILSDLFLNCYDKVEKFMGITYTRKNPTMLNYIDTPYYSQ